jgi:hypothetical protein
MVMKRNQYALRKALSISCSIRSISSNDFVVPGRQQQIFASGNEVTSGLNQRIDWQIPDHPQVWRDPPRPATIAEIAPRPSLHSAAGLNDALAGASDRQASKRRPDEKLEADECRHRVARQIYEQRRSLRQRGACQERVNAKIQSAARLDHLPNRSSAHASLADGKSGHLSWTASGRSFNCGAA